MTNAQKKWTALLSGILLGLECAVILLTLNLLWPMSITCLLAVLILAIVTFSKIIHFKLGICLGQKIAKIFDINVNITKAIVMHI